MWVFNGVPVNELIGFASLCVAYLTSLEWGLELVNRD